MTAPAKSRARGYRALPFFRPSQAQLAAMETVFRGHPVADLGAGRFLAGTHALIKQGASKVYAVDYLPLTALESPVPRGASYQKVDLAREWSPPAGCRLALLSWPAKDIFDDGPAWEKILAQFDQVVYLGRTDAYSGCGSPRLWRHLARRDLVREVEGSHNDLLIYGKVVRAFSAPRCREERAVWAHLMPRASGLALA
jgi:hypothetical protein